MKNTQRPPDYQEDYTSDIIREMELRKKKELEMQEEDFSYLEEFSKPGGNKKEKDLDIPSEDEYNVKKNVSIRDRESEEDYAADIIKELQAKKSREEKITDLSYLQDYDREKEKKAFEPFPEEFDKKKVINKKDEFGREKPFQDEFDIDALLNYDEEKHKSEIFKNLPEDLDIDSLLKYDDELRKKKAFSENYNVDAEIEADSLSDEEILRKNFKDFLVLRKISGQKTDYPHSSRIPANKITSSEKEIEISDDPVLKEQEKKHASTVTIHKNEHGEIEVIEVLCSCGVRTLIRLDYSMDDMPDFKIKENKSLLVKKQTTPDLIPSNTSIKPQETKPIEAQKENIRGTTQATSVQKSNQPKIPKAFSDTDKQDLINQIGKQNIRADKNIR